MDWGVHTMSVAVSQCSLLWQEEAWAEQCPMNQTVNDSIQATSASLPPPAQQGEAHCDSRKKSVAEGSGATIHFYSGSSDFRVENHSQNKQPQFINLPTIQSSGSSRRGWKCGIACSPRSVRGEICTYGTEVPRSLLISSHQPPP